MKVLDLFCGAGGAAMGLHRAFPDAQILGIDIEPQPHYPFIFVQADAMEFPLAGFDFIWASPPCQRYSAMCNAYPGLAEKYPDLVPGTRERLAAQKAPWVIENVVNAPLIDPVTLCGEMFGLGVIRHRLFESSFRVEQPVHPAHKRGVYVPVGRPVPADAPYMTVAGHIASVGEARRRMGIDWMNRDELAEAVPPAYAEYIGQEFLASQTLSRAS